MARQLNIRSDEAYAIARRLAARRGTTVTEAVTHALRTVEQNESPLPEVSPNDAAETYRILMELSRWGSKHKLPGATSDHRDLYDEFGLPK